jgi:hypothetical protein
MIFKFLYEAHNFRNGDTVRVSSRKSPVDEFIGKIYGIYTKPLHPQLANSPFVDYFYVKFDHTIYHSILQRGWSVIYKGSEQVIGDVERDKSNQITRIFIQFAQIPEEEISLKNIDAILIWRVGYKINQLKYTNSSV